MIINVVLHYYFYYLCYFNMCCLYGLAYIMLKKTPHWKMKPADEIL